MTICAFNNKIWDGAYLWEVTIIFRKLELSMNSITMKGEELDLAAT